MPASMGRPHFPTPVGVYTVLSKERTVIMDSSSVGVPITDPEGYKTPVEYATRFTNRGLFVHSAPWALHVPGSRKCQPWLHQPESLLTPSGTSTTANIGDPIVVKE